MLGQNVATHDHDDDDDHHDDDDDDAGAGWWWGWHLFCVNISYPVAVNTLILTRRSCPCNYRRPQLPPFHKWHAGVARGSSWKAGESCVAVWPTSFPAAFPCHLLGHRFPRNTLVALVARGKLQDSPRVWRFGRFTSVAPKLDTSPTSAMSHHYEANIHQRPNSGLKSQTDLNCMLAFDQFYPWEILISHIFSHLIPDLINLILKFLHFLGLCGIFQRQIFRMISQHLLRPWPLVLDYFALVGLGRLATGPGHQWRWSRQGWRWILSAVDAQHVGFEAPPKVKLPKWQETRIKKWLRGLRWIEGLWMTSHLQVDKWVGEILMIPWSWIGLNSKDGRHSKSRQTRNG